MDLKLKGGEKRSRSLNRDNHHSSRDAKCLLFSDIFLLSLSPAWFSVHSEVSAASCSVDGDVALSVCVSVTLVHCWMDHHVDRNVLQMMNPYEFSCSASMCFFWSHCGSCGSSWCQLREFSRSCQPDQRVIFAMSILVFFQYQQYK